MEKFLLKLSKNPLPKQALQDAVNIFQKFVDLTRHAGESITADLLREADTFETFVASAVLSMAWDLFTFVTPIHGTRLGLSASVIGLILGAFGAAIFLVRLVLPAIVHRLSEWPLLIGGMLATRVPMGRAMRADEIAGLARYLASPACSGMTGQALTIDGGMLTA